MQWSFREKGKVGKMMEEIKVRWGGEKRRRSREVKWKGKKTITGIVKVCRREISG